MSRPDIGFAVHAIQRQSHKPGVAQYDACMRLLRYLKGTIERGITYYPSDHPSGREPRLVTFSDADFAGQKTLAGGKKSCKSQSGAISFLAGGPVHWTSRLQRLTAQSSCESEFYALIAATKSTIAIRQLLAELGEYDAISDGTVIATDNEAAITCSIQPTSLKNRHFCLSTELVRDHAENNNIHVFLSLIHI